MHCFLLRLLGLLRLHRLARRLDRAIGFLLDYFNALLRVTEAFFVYLGLPLDYLLEAPDPFELALQILRVQPIRPHRGKNDKYVCPATLLVFLYARLFVKHPNYVSEVDCFAVALFFLIRTYNQNTLRNVQHKVSEVELAKLEKLLRADVLVEVAFMLLEGQLSRFLDCLGTFDLFLAWIGKSCYCRKSSGSIEPFLPTVQADHRCDCRFPSARTIHHIYLFLRRCFLLHFGLGLQLQVPPDIVVVGEPTVAIVQALDSVPPESGPLLALREDDKLLFLDWSFLGHQEL